MLANPPAIDAIASAETPAPRMIPRTAAITNATANATIRARGGASLPNRALQPDPERRFGCCAIRVGLNPDCRKAVRRRPIGRAGRCGEAAVQRTAGALTGVYPPGYLERLRSDW